MVMSDGVECFDCVGRFLYHTMEDEICIECDVCDMFFEIIDMHSNLSNVGWTFTTTHVEEWCPPPHICCLRKESCDPIFLV